MGSQSPEIIQIIPPSGDWFAVYLLEETNELIKDRVICFALQTDGSIEPQSMDASGCIDCPGRETNFIGYFEGAQIPAWMIDEGPKIVKAREERRERRLAMNRKKSA